MDLSSLETSEKQIDTLIQSKHVLPKGEKNH